MFSKMIVFDFFIGVNIKFSYGHVLYVTCHMRGYLGPNRLNYASCIYFLFLVPI